MPLLQDFLGFKDRRAIERIYEYYVSATPGLRDSIPELRDLFSEKYPKAREMQEADIADLSLISELEQSGFIAHFNGGGVETSKDFSDRSATGEMS